MNPTGETTPSPAKPNIAKRFFSQAGNALGVQVAPRIETVSDAQKPQDTVPPVFENAFKNTSEVVSIVPEPTIVPAEPVAQAPVAEVRIEQPVQPHIAEFTPSPAVSVPEPETPPVAVPSYQPETVESAPAEPVPVLSMNFSLDKSTTQETEKPKTTEPISMVSRLLLKTNLSAYILPDGHIDEEALKRDSSDPEKVREVNPSMGNLLADLQAKGLSGDEEIVSKALGVISSRQETSKAA